MSSLVGTRRLLLLIARVDRVRLSVWVLTLGLFPSLVASAFANLYPTVEGRAELVATVASAPALVALLGPVNGTSVGALTVWRIGTIGGVMVALMAAFTVIRHTRLEEETGRRELLGATAVGRNAPLVAAFLAAIIAGATIAVMVGGGLVLLGESASGGLAFGLAWLLLAAVFAAIGALCAQVVQSSGGARGLAGAVVGIAFALRLAGDGGADQGIGWLSWLSPIGWGTKLEPYGRERWWVAALLLGLATVVGTVAFVVAGRRDVGAGLLRERGGPATASPRLLSAFGLSRRMHERGLVGWLVGVALFGAIWGVLADTMTTLVSENPQLASIFEALGGTGRLTDVFFGAAFGLLGLLVSAYAITATLTLRHEEEGLRADPVLATATPRLTWAWSHLSFAFLAPIALLLAAAVTSGVSYGIIAGDPVGQVLGLVDAALVQLPAVWVTAGAAVALYGLLPRLSGLSWGVLVTFLLLGQLGQILELPQWALDVSPFTHVPQAPRPVTAGPLIALTAVAAGLVTAGLTGLQRRDMT